MSADRYPTYVFWSDDDEGFIAKAPDLQGCSAFGETQDQALAELKPAIDAWIEAAKAAGNPVPEPSRPAEEESYSGKVLLRMPKTLHAQLARAANSEDISLNQYVVFLLTQMHTRRTTEKAIINIMGKWQSNLVVVNQVRSNIRDLCIEGRRITVSSTVDSAPRLLDPFLTHREQITTSASH